MEEDKYIVAELEKEGEYAVVNRETGTSYIVRLKEGHCTCPDFSYHRFQEGEPCKHIRLVSEKTGKTPTLPTIYREISIARTDDAEKEIAPT